MTKSELEKKLTEITTKLKQVEIAYNQLFGQKLLLEDLIKGAQDEKKETEQK